MKFLKKLLGKRVKEAGVEHAIIIHFQYGKDKLDDLYKLRDKLEQRINDKKLGEYDGHEIATNLSDGYLYMYGQNAEFLFSGIKEILEETEFMKGAKAKLRFGPPEDGIKEITIEIGK
jgi:hypothetical protein